jgi:hypothetical protein
MNNLLTPFENAIVRLHRRYLVGDNYRAAARLVIRAKLQFKFTLVRALQQQLGHVHARTAVRRVQLPKHPNQQRNVSRS